MEVEFSLTVEDLRAFQRYHMESERRSGKTSPPRGQTFWVVVLLLVAGLSIVTDKYRGTKVNDIVFFILLGALLGVMGMVFFYRWRLGKLSLASQQQAVQDQRNGRYYRIAPEGVTTEGEFNRTFDRWPGILKIAATADHAFFYFTANRTCIFPRRAFRNAQHFEEFVKLARRYHEETRKPTGIITQLPGGSTAITRDIE